MNYYCVACEGYIVEVVGPKRDLDYVSCRKCGRVSHFGDVVAISLEQPHIIAGDMAANSARDRGWGIN